MRVAGLFGVVLVVAGVGSAGFGFAGAQAKKAAVLRSGEVTTCDVERDCRQEMTDGRRTFTMEVNGLVVRAALGQEQKVSYADLRIENKTAEVLEVLPEDFRIEVDEVRFKRLSYVDPAGKQHARLERAEERPGHGLPPPAYWTSVEHKEAKEARLAAQGSKVTLLAQGPVPVGASVTGRVYFERPRGTTDRSLILPFRGAVLEFPFAKPEAAGKGKATGGKATGGAGAQE